MYLFGIPSNGFQAGKQLAYPLATAMPAKF